MVLEKLATGLDVPLAWLFDAPAAPAIAGVATQGPGRMARSRLGLHPAQRLAVGLPLARCSIVEVVFPAGARVAYETGARPGVTHQQIWVLQGALEVTLGKERYELGTGDCLAMVLDRPITFRNRTAKPARYAVILDSSAARLTAWTPPTSPPR